MKPAYVKIDNKDCVIISEKLYSGLVRSLAYKINYHVKVKKLKKENIFLKNITHQFKAIESNNDNDDTFIIASKTYFLNNTLGNKYIYALDVMEYIYKYQDDPKYSTSQLIKDLTDLCL